MRKRLLHLGASLAFLLTLVAAPLPAFAEGGSGSGGSGSGENETTTTNTTTSTTSGGTSTETENETTTETPKTGTTTENETNDTTSGGKQHRLEANRLRVCEKRKGTIQTIMSRSTERAQNQINLFDTIAKRVEDFYASKGKTLSNYDALVADVSSAKTQAETDLATLKTVNFTCDANDPKAAAAAFKAALLKEIQDLKAYRTAVKNLIVGVKSAQGTESEGSNQ